VQLHQDAQRHGWAIVLAARDRSGHHVDRRQKQRNANVAIDQERHPLSTGPEVQSDDGPNHVDAPGEVGLFSLRTPASVQEGAIKNGRLQEEPAAIYVFGFGRP
jgi:hypothetical protein